MKKISLVMIMCLIISLTGCAKVINTEYKNVEVHIVDKYYRGMWMQPVRSGKITTFVTHPAVYNITVEYNNAEYTINDSNIYDRYKDKIGHTTVGTLETRTYDDGTVKYNIIGLK